MAKIYTLVNQKGGVGKTTSAINLGAFLGHYDQRVLIVDVDPQANATTGYQWALKNTEAQDVCLLLSSEYEPSDSGLAGAGGFQVWTFAALERGDATLEFEYLRPWETGAEPAQKHTACVVVW